MTLANTLIYRWAEQLLALQPLAQPAVLEAGREGLIDYLACALGGAQDPGLAALDSVLTAPAGHATVIGRGLTCDAAHAALLNGYSGHALDYDDVHRSVRGHPSTVLLPALLAVAQVRELSAERLLGAYAVGVEAMARLGLAMGPGHYEAGYHNTATLGAVAAAAACGWLIDLPAAVMSIAIGIAVTQASGLRLQFGSQVKPLHAGLAARTGLTSALLAEAGLSGAEESLAGPGGFLALYGQGQSVPERLLSTGQGWQILEPGLIFKRYASCAATHHAADAALALQVRLRLSPESIEQLEVIFPEGLTAPLAKSLPSTRDAGRFSVEYVVAHALAHGHLDFAAFTAGPIDQPSAALMARVQVKVDPKAPSIASAPLARFSVLKITERSGQVHSLRVDAPRGGSPTEKFLAAAGATASARQLLEQIQHMRSAADLHQVLTALANPLNRDETAQ